MFGNFKIYKMQEKPYEYIMKKTYHGPYDNNLLEDKKKRYANAPRNKNVVSFDMVELKLGIFIITKSNKNAASIWNSLFYVGITISLSRRLS